MRKVIKRAAAIMLAMALSFAVTPAGIASAEEDFGGAVPRGNFSGPTLIADCSKPTKPVNPSMFGYILTPNFDVAESRMSLLGPIINRETLPVQNFQAIGDLSPDYYPYESSIKERTLAAYRRAKDAGLVYYMMLGMTPSWASPHNPPTPVDAYNTTHLKTPEQDADFKQYVKDILLYMRDHGAKPDFTNLTNEYWTGLEKTYHGLWEAVREVYPDFIPATGPDPLFRWEVPDYYVPYAAQNDITVEGPAWHEFWWGGYFANYTDLKSWYDHIINLKNDNKKANVKYVIWGENNAGTGDPLPSEPQHAEFARSMSNVVRVGVDYNVKGCLESENWNGMSDLLNTKGTNQNTGIRRRIWWTYYMFSQLSRSGNYVEVDVPNSGNNQTFTGAVSVDEKEELIKVIVAKDNRPGPVTLKLNNIPFDTSGIEVDLYKVVDEENDGLQFQRELTPALAGQDIELFLEGEDMEANTAWMVIVKTDRSKPEFFHPKTPDDGEAAESQPTFTWSESRGAESYTLTVSKNKDLSDPVIMEEGLTELSYTPDNSLDIGERYYWSVTAVNANGSRTVSNDVKYSLLVKEDDRVPGQFAPFLPSPEAKNESTTVELQWSPAYSPEDAPVSYRLVVAEDEDFSNSVFERSDITSVRRTAQFGDNSQVYFKIPSGILDYNTKYYWTVYAVNQYGERPINGPQLSFTTAAEGNSPLPFHLVYPADGEDDINGRAILEWEESPNAFFYKLEISDQPDMSNIVLQRNHMIYNRYILEQNGLEPGKTYYWRVTAYDKEKNYHTECESGIWSFTMEQTPTSPLLYADQPGNEDGEVQLWFHSSDQADSYNVYYGREKGIYTRKISGITVEDGSNGEFTVSGLQGGQTYYFAVTAENAAGESDIWNERSVEPAGDGTGWTGDDEQGERISWMIRATAGSGGTVQGAGRYYTGANAALTARAMEGYTFEGWFEDGVKVWDHEKYSFRVLKERKLEARFQKRQYTITAGAGTGGSVKGGGVYFHGATAVLTAMPSSGYRFVRWLEGNNPISTNAQFSFAVNRERTLKAEFAPAEEIKPVVPAAPASLKVKSAGYNSLSLSWKKADHASGYEIYRAAGKKKNYKKIKTVTASGYKDNRLVTGKRYYYKVYAVYETGTGNIRSKASKTVSAKPTLPKVSSLKVIKSSSTAGQLKWKKVKGATRYQVYRAASAKGKYKKIATVKKIKYRDSRLAPGKKYFYKVRAARKAGGRYVTGKFSTVRKWN